MNKRIDHNMNSLRILAILLVILVHSDAMVLWKVAEGQVATIPSIILITFSVIGRISVPLFVIISGRYVLNSLEKISTKEFYLKRVPRLIVPMLFWSVIFFGVCLIAEPDTTIISYLKDFVTGFATNAPAIHIWYLYMLLGLYLVSPLIYKLIKKVDNKKLIIIGIVVTLLGFGVEIAKNLTGINVWIFWWMENVGLFIMGYAVRNLKLYKKRNLLLFSAIVIEIIASATSFVLLNGGNMLGAIFFWGLTPTTTATAILLYMYFNSIEMKENIVSTKAKYVLGIYLFHPIVLMLIGKISTGAIVLDVVGKWIFAFLVSLFLMMALYKVKFMRKFIS